MKRHTQEILYHLLPVVFWLLAIGGSVLPVFIVTFPNSQAIQNYLYGFLVAAIVLICIAIIAHIKRHESAVTPCFHVAFLLGVASYWVPTIVFMMLPFWIYIQYRRLFNMRVFVASLIGFALVAIWASIGVYIGWIANPWAEFFASKNAWGWIPTGAILITWLASTIARQNLRVR